MNNFEFHPATTEGQRDSAVLTLRKDGFTASRETNTLRTDATRAQVAFSVGGSVLAVTYAGGRWTTQGKATR
jgi:hypothetical protein